MKDYSNKNTLIYELAQLRKNTDKYINNELGKQQILLNIHKNVKKI